MRKLPKFIWLKEMMLHDGASYSKDVYLTCKGEQYTVAFGKRSPFHKKVWGNYEYHDKCSIKRITIEEGYPERFLNMWKQYDNFLYKNKKNARN